MAQLATHRLQDGRSTYTVATTSNDNCGPSRMSTTASLRLPPFRTMFDAMRACRDRHHGATCRRTTEHLLSASCAARPSRQSPESYPRYLALPTTTPECDSLLAWHSRGANPWLSHHAFASSAVANRSFITVIQNWPS